jgi:hypothetical protein
MSTLRAFMTAAVLSQAACMTSVGGVSTDPPAPVDPLAVQPALIGSIALAASYPELMAQRFDTRFRLDDLRDLCLAVRVAAVPKVASLTISLINPAGGRIYQRTEMFGVDPTLKTVEWSMMQRKNELRQPRAIPGGQSLELCIPIGGSVLERYPQRQGAWGVEATIEGVPGTLTTTMMVDAPR